MPSLMNSETKFVIKNDAHNNKAPEMSLRSKDADSIFLSEEVD